MNNIKLYIKWMIKHPIKTMFVFLGIMCIPLIVIHLLFSLETNCDFVSAKWTAGDILSYISGFVAFFGTVVLGAVSIWQTEKANQTNEAILKLTRENEKKAVLPYLTFTEYLYKYTGSYLQNLFAGKQPEIQEDSFPEINRVDFTIEKLIFYIDSDKIEITADLTDEEKKLIKSNHQIIEENENTKTLTSTNVFYKLIKVENNGKGTAVNLKCRLLKCGNEGDEKFDVYSIAFSLPVGKYFDLGFYINRSDVINILGEYKLEFSYEDI